MTPESFDRVKTSISAVLNGTPFEVTDLIALPDGKINFVLRGTLKTPLNDAAKSKYILIKHSEPFAKWDSNIKVPIERCEIEVKALQAVSAMPSSPASAVITTPTFLFHSDTFHTHAQTYFPNGSSLRSYLSKRLAQPSFPPHEYSAIHDFATALGSWLAEFHSWANTAAVHTSLGHLAEKNIALQTLKWRLYYGSLVKSKATFPDALDCLSDHDIANITSFTREEAEGSKTLIQGDFWTGNIIVSDIPLSISTPMTAFVVDWELLCFGSPAMDVGQMIAEFYLLFLFHDIAASMIISQGFISAYMSSISPEEREALAFRALLHIGAHIISVPANMNEWDNTKWEKVAKEGARIVKAAWSKDREFFREHPLESMFL